MEANARGTRYQARIQEREARMSVSSSIDGLNREFASIQDLRLRLARKLDLFRSLESHLNFFPTGREAQALATEIVQLKRSIEEAEG